MFWWVCTEIIVINSSEQYQLLNTIDRGTQYLVNGFIHRIENKYKLKTNIPSSIISICILFFYLFW